MKREKALVRKKLRIGIDCLYAVPGKTAGTWVFAKNLLEELTDLDTENEYFVFLSSLAAADFRLDRPNLRFVTSRIAGISVGTRLGFQNVGLPFLARYHRLDLIHSLGNYGPLRPLVRSVVTVHDILAPLDQRRSRGAGPKLQARTLDFLRDNSLRRADRIAVDSDFTRKDLVARYPFAGDKVRVVYGGLPRREPSPPISAQQLLAGKGIRTPYLLAVGLLDPRKNIVRLIEAFARLKYGAGIPHQLVLVGEPGANRVSLHAAVAQAAVKDFVVFTGFVSDVEVAAFYSAADLFVFPSSMEGFGLPLLEAMANRVPVVCSNAGSLPEVAGDGALLFDPLEVGDMARAIKQVLQEPSLRARLVACGLKRVELFSFRRAAEATLALYEEVVLSKRGTSPAPG